MKMERIVKVAFVVCATFVLLMAMASLAFGQEMEVVETVAISGTAIGVAGMAIASAVTKWVVDAIKEAIPRLQGNMTRLIAFVFAEVAAFGFDLQADVDALGIAASGAFGNFVTGLTIAAGGGLVANVIKAKK